MIKVKLVEYVKWLESTIKHAHHELDKADNHSCDERYWKGVALALEDALYQLEKISRD